MALIFKTLVDNHNLEMSLVLSVDTQVLSVRFSTILQGLEHECKVSLYRSGMYKPPVKISGGQKYVLMLSGDRPRGMENIFFGHFTSIGALVSSKK